MSYVRTAEHNTKIGEALRGIRRSTEHRRKNGLVHTKHGRYGTATYNSWKTMKQRCFNSNHVAYERYGGRGITVCERWLTFENFLADMGERPEGKTLDRIDSNGNYEPGNCRWATPVEQQRNRRRP